MDKHGAERHERKFRERRNQHPYKHAMAYDGQAAYGHGMDRGPKKRFARLDSDDEPAFNPRKKGRCMPEPEHHSERHTPTLADKRHSKPWGKCNYPNTSARRTKRRLTSVPPYPGFSDFSYVFSPELIPETALPGRLKGQREGNRIFNYKSRWQAVDLDGDVLMTDAESEMVIVDSSFLRELDERLRNLEFAKKSWEFEVKEEFKAKLNKTLYRLDALEESAESRYRQSRLKTK